MDRYTPECSKLLAQYKTTLKLLGDEVPSLDAFVSEYRVGDAPHLSQLGIPSSVGQRIVVFTDTCVFYSWIAPQLFQDSRSEYQLLWNIVQNKVSNPPSGLLKRHRYAASLYPKWYCKPDSLTTSKYLPT